MGAKFDDTFKISTTALYLNQSHPSMPLNLKWVMKIIVFYILYCPMFVFMINSIIYHDGFTEICTNLSLAIVYPIITTNYVVLVVYKKSFEDMIKMTEEDLELSTTLEEEDEAAVKKYTAKGIWASKFWLFMIIFGDGMFYIKPLATPYSALTGNLTLVPMIELSYPAYIEERKNEVDMYLVLLFLQVFYAFFTCLMYIGFNPLGPIFIMHACGQIELATRHVGRLFVQDVDKEDTIKRLQDIVLHVQRIYSFIDKIQQTHKALFEMCLKSSALMIPIICLVTVELYNNDGTISVEMISYVFACFMQCLIPCYYCEVLLRKGENLRVAIYGCGWEKYWVPRSRPFILLMLTRSVRPLCIRSVFCTVCLEAFADVTNQAYRIFHVMNAAWNRS